MSNLFAPQLFYRNFLVHFRFDFAVLDSKQLYSITKLSLVLKISNVTKKVLKINCISHMQNARSTAAISRASEGYHFSHDALVTCKLPINTNELQMSIASFCSISLSKCCLNHHENVKCWKIFFPTLKKYLEKFGQNL